MNERPGYLVRNSLLAMGAFAIVVLFMLFYSTVTGAVDRASQRRVASVDNARLLGSSAAMTSAPRFVALGSSTR